MKIFLLFFFVFFFSRCIAQQIEFIIEDTLKKIHITQKNNCNILKQKKIKIKTSILNNTEQTQVLLFIDKNIIPTSSKVYYDTLNFEDNNNVLLCSGLRSILYDSQHNIINPAMIKSGVKRFKCFIKFIDNIKSYRLSKHDHFFLYNFTKKIILYPREKKNITFNVFLSKKFKEPLFIKKERITYKQHEYQINKGIYYLQLNYFTYNKDSRFPDYVKYSNYYLLRALYDKKIEDVSNCIIKDKIFIGHIKSNKIQLIIM